MSDRVKGRRLLVVEDEFLIALDVRATVADLGGWVVQLASHLDQALDQARTADIDAALLDVNVNGAHIYPVASVLRERGIPFAFVTGYDDLMLPDGFAGAPLLKKPFCRDDIARVLMELATQLAR